MKIAIFGDVHGEKILLERLYKKVNSQHQIDQWYSCGDLIDRGPDSKGVLDFVISNSIQAVRGNHEQMALGAIQEFKFNIYNGEALQYWCQYGGRECLASFSPIEEFESYWSFLYSLPYYRKTKHAYIFHAGCPHYIRDTMIWEKNHEYLWWADHYNVESMFKPLDKIQVIGHSSVRKPVFSKRHIAIDTGCGLYKDGRLTALILPEMQIISVGHND